MAKTTYYTEKGYKKLKQQVHQLISVERPAIAQQIDEARDKGDLSENAEYKAAKEAQNLLEIRIKELQEILHHARIIDESTIDNTKVFLFSKVTVKNLSMNKTMTYDIVPANESDIKEGKLSVESPVAKGLLGKKEGDIAEIQVPAGILKFEILKIESSIK